MLAARVTNLDMPPKVTDDKLFATEVEAIRAALNTNAGILDSLTSAPAVDLYDPTHVYAVDNLVRYTPQGSPQNFYAALAAGLLAAPGPGNLVQWKQVSPPAPPTALWQAITLATAQSIEGAGVQAGRLYQANFGPDGQGRTQYVYLMGLDQFFDTTRGVLEVDGVRTAIEKIDLGAGTWQLAGSSARLITAERLYDATTNEFVLLLSYDAPTAKNAYGLAALSAGTAPQPGSLFFNPQYFNTQYVK